MTAVIFLTLWLWGTLFFIAEAQLIRHRLWPTTWLLLPLWPGVIIARSAVVLYRWYRLRRLMAEVWKR